MLPNSLTIYTYAYAMDGGTIVLMAYDSNQNDHSITLAQHGFLDIKNTHYRPGRLYFNELFVPIRSEMETAVLALLQNAHLLTNRPSDSIKTMCAAIIAFVMSDEYLNVARQVDKLQPLTGNTS
jgi:hypothetical protein